MPKRITVTDEEYFKILELKATYKTDNLFDLLEELTKRQSVKYDINVNEPQQPINTEQPEQPINPERLPDTKNQNNQKSQKG